MEKPTPLINSAMLPNYRGQVVRIIGKVHKLVGTTLLIQTSDMGNVEVHLNRDTTLAGTYVEIIGKVSDSGEELREYTCINFGDSLDMDLVEKVVQIQGAFPAVFVGSE